MSFKELDENDHPSNNDPHNTTRPPHSLAAGFYVNKGMEESEEQTTAMAEVYLQTRLLLSYHA